MLRGHMTIFAHALQEVHMPCQPLSISELLTASLSVILCEPFPQALSCSVSQGMWAAPWRIFPCKFFLSFELRRMFTEAALSMLAAKGQELWEGGKKKERERTISCSLWATKSKPTQHNLPSSLGHSSLALSSFKVWWQKYFHRLPCCTGCWARGRGEVEVTGVSTFGKG